MHALMKGLLLVMILGAGFVRADVATFTLSAQNAALAAGATPAPYGTISVSVPDPGGAATITVEHAGSYRFGGGGIIAFNVAGSTAGLSVTGLPTLRSVLCCSPIVIPGFGGFEVVLVNRDGYLRSVPAFNITVNRTGGFDSAWDLVEFSDPPAPGGSRAAFLTHVYNAGGTIDGFAAVTVVPEPASLVLFGAGLLVVGWFVNRGSRRLLPARPPVNPR